MQKEGIDGALIVHNPNLFYFTGTVHQAYLFIPREGDPLFFIRKNHERARLESALDYIIPVKGPSDLPKLMAGHGYAKLNTLGMELDVLPANHYFRYVDIFKPSDIVDVWPCIQEVRALKSAYERTLMQEVAVLSDFMVETGRKGLREGITEVGLASIVEAAARARGHEGFIRMRSFNQEGYWGHLLSGPDAAYFTFIESPTGGRGLSHAFPQGAGLRRIRRNEPVIIDLVSCKYGYLIDQTRTMSLGPLPGEMEDAYNVSLEIIGTLEEIIQPGIPVGLLFEKAQQIAGAHGLENRFMGYGNRRIAFCGHGIGIELDEFPVVMKGGKAILRSEMTIALEPKFHFPGAGVVGVEDTFVVTDHGSQKLTHAHYAVDVTA